MPTSVFHQNMFKTKLKKKKKKRRRMDLLLRGKKLNMREIERGRKVQVIGGG